MAYTFKSKIEYETIIVDVLYDGNKIGQQPFSTLYDTTESAIEFVTNTTENNGWLGSDGKFYPAGKEKTPEPEPPVDPLQENMDKATSKLTELNQSLTPDMFNIDVPMMEEDDVLKKMIISQSSSVPEERISDETADEIVASYPNNHPTKAFIKEKKKEVKTAVKQLGFKGKEIIDGTIQLTTETIAAFVTIGSSAAIMPIGAGLPTAFSAVQGLFASLKAFQTKLNQLQPILEPLKYVEMLVNTEDNTPEGDAGKASIESINVALGTITGLISGVAGVVSPITQVKNTLGGTKIPGVGGPENPTPPEPIEHPILMWGNNSGEVAPGTDVWISSNPKGGTWQYKYWWSSDNDPAVVNKSTQSVNVNPRVTTTYSVGVTNKSGEGNTAWGNWTVVVKPQNTTQSSTSSQSTV